MTNTLYNAQQLIPRLIDFREIDANNYDEWEQFSECLLREMGYVVVQPPGRGADGGKDMVVAIARAHVNTLSVVNTSPIEARLLGAAKSKIFLIE